MARSRSSHTWLETATAMRIGIAVVVAFAGLMLSPTTAWAVDATDRTLSAELLIMQADLVRLRNAALPPRHREGLTQRLQGTLGVVPWMLRRAGDTAGAQALRPWQDRALENGDDRARLSALLQNLSARHPLNVRAFEDHADTPAIRREARVVHQTYCAGCHDGAGAGDPDEALPARDLYVLARTESAVVFLARLVNGVKGDASLRFTNPLAERQIAALWRLYRRAK